MTEGGAIATSEELHGLELDITAAHCEAEAAHQVAEAAHERLDRVEAAIRELASNPGSPYFAARAAEVVLDGPDVGHAFYCKYSAGETCSCGRQYDVE